MAMNKVKPITKKVQSTKVNKAATVRGNAKRTFTKTTYKTGKLNEMLNTGTAI